MDIICILGVRRVATLHILREADLDTLIEQAYTIIYSILLKEDRGTL